MNNIFQMISLNFNLALIFLIGKTNWDTIYIIALIITQVLLNLILTMLTHPKISRSVCIKTILLILVVFYIALASLASFVYGDFNIILFILHILLNITYPIYTFYQTRQQNKKTLKDMPIKEINKYFKGKKGIK